MILCLCLDTNAATIVDILELFSKATRMDINIGKSIFSTHLLSATELQVITRFVPYKLEYMDGGLKYLGFFLQPNSY